MQFKKKLDSNTLSIIIGIALPVVVLVVLYFMGVFGTIGVSKSAKEEVEQISYNDSYFAEYDDSADIATAAEQIATLVEDVEEINVYVYATEDDSNAKVNTSLVTLLECFDNISLTYIDTEEDTDFKSNYPNASLSSNDIIVECGRMYKVISYGNYSNNYGVYFNSDIYNSVCDDDGVYTSTYCLADAVLNAINYILSDETILVYELTGHDETEIDGDFLDVLTEKEYMVFSLDLSEEAQVPDDCNLLIIHAPQSDLTDEEMSAIEAYFEAGGKIFFTILYDAWSELENFNQLIADYGVTTTEDVIFDDDTSWCYESTQYYLLPYIESNYFTSEITGSAGVFVPYSLGLSSKKVAGYSYTKVAMTSITSYVYGDTEYTGPYTIIMAVTNDNSGCFFISGSSYTYLDTSNEYAEGVNADFFSELMDAIISLEK